MQDKPILKRIINIVVPFVFLIGITLLSSFLYLHEGIAYGDDAAFHLGNIYDCYYSLTSGLGIDSTNHYMMGIYAYNTHLFYAPLPHYFAAIIMVVFRCSNFVAIKISISFFCFIGALFFYLFAKKISKSMTVSLLGSAFFIFCPYRMFCGYCRFAYAETIAISLLPVLFYGIYSFIKDEKPTYRCFLAIILGVSGLVLSHPFTALSATIVALLYMAIHYKDVWKTIKNRKGIVLSLLSVVTIFTLVGFYVFPMLIAKNANLYRISDDVVMWTTYEHVSGSTSSSGNFSGFLNIDWIKATIAAGRWPVDQPIYIYLVEAVLLISAFIILMLSDYFTNKYLSKRWLISVVNVIVFWVLPLTFIWLIHDVVFYLAAILIIVIYLINVFFEEKPEVTTEENQNTTTFEKTTIIDIVFLVIFSIVILLFIFVGQLWHIVPSLFYMCQFAWRLWAMLTITTAWLFIIILDRAINSLHRHKYITPLLIVPSLLIVATMSFREKGVALNYPESHAYVVYHYDENDAMEVNNIGAMNEYMPQIFYNSKYESEYSNSLYETIKSTIGYHQEYVFTKDDYIAPSFLTGEGTLTCTYLNTPEVHFDAVIEENSLIQIPQFYYDGYQIDLINKQTNAREQVEVINIDSLVSFKANKGEYDIRISYKGPMIRRVFNIFFYIGLSAILALSVLSVIELYLQNKKKAE